jgi:hypothetical protein
MTSDIDALLAALKSPRPRDNLAAIEAAASLRAAGAPLVAELIQFLTSQAYVPCTAREYEFSGHAILAGAATRTIEAIGVAPDMDDVRRLLADHRIFTLPKACYDQGAYIGDYDSETTAPAGNAARLVALLGQGGFALLPQLAGNARHEAEEIGRPARRAIADLAKLAPQATVAIRQDFIAAIDRIADLPEALTPTTSRGFDLRDLARACRRELGGG